MHHPESVVENERNKVHWDFQMQTDHLITARRPHLVIVKKCQIMDLAVLADYRVIMKVSKEEIRT